MITVSSPGEFELKLITELGLSRETAAAVLRLVIKELDELDKFTLPWMSEFLEGWNTYSRQLRKALISGD